MMADAGIPTPRFYVAETVPQATQAAKDLGGSDCVLKAQVSQIINYLLRLVVNSLRNLCGAALFILCFFSVPRMNIKWTYRPTQTPFRANKPYFPILFTLKS